MAINKKYSLFASLLLVMFSFSVVLADDSEIIPDEDETSAIGNSIDKIRLSFTFNSEKKIKRALEFAEKRLAEAEALEDENPEKAAKARQRYESFVEKAEIALEKIENAGSDSEEESEEDIGRMARIQERFEEHREKASAIHARRLERLENQNATEEKINRVNERYDSLVKRMDAREERVLNRFERARNTHKRLAEKSDEEIEDIIEEIEDKEGITESRLKRIERTEIRIERFSGLRDRDIARLQERFNSANLTEEEKTLIQEKIDRFNSLSASFEENAYSKIDEARVRDLRTDNLSARRIDGLNRILDGRVANATV
ncbi:MAG: hypothetical protein IH845_03530 [Nanoarchaeota archaeon]|nr:hypothetical protein [Nanoarchaeota archaeon]